MKNGKLVGTCNTSDVTKDEVLGISFSVNCRASRAVRNWKACIDGIRDWLGNHL